MQETGASSEVWLDVFTQTVWWSWCAINAFTLQNFECKTNIFKYVGEKYNDSFTYETKPVDGGKWLFESESH